MPVLVPVPLTGRPDHTLSFFSLPSCSLCGFSARTVTAGLLHALLLMVPRGRGRGSARLLAVASSPTATGFWGCVGWGHVRSLDAGRREIETRR